jgi:hypothetical protein
MLLAQFPYVFGQKIVDMDIVQHQNMGIKLCNDLAQSGTLLDLFDDFKAIRVSQYMLQTSHG